MNASSRQKAVPSFARFVLLVVMCFVAVGCSSDSRSDDPSVQSPRDVDVFEVDAVVVLEEPEGRPITGIDDMAVLESGALVVVDSKAGQIRLHDDRGALVTMVSEAGEGPGEFRRPLRVAALPGGGFAATGASPKVSVFDADGALVNEIGTDGLGAVELEAVDHNRVILASATSSSATFVLLHLDDGSFEFVYDRDPRFANNEEWRVAVRDHAAVFDGTVLIAASLAYPLTTVNLRSGSTQHFGREPGSWVQATRPEPSTQVMQRLPGWLVSFTFVSGVWALANERDGFLIVQHARFSESASARLSTLFSWAPYAIDVYRHMGVKILEDVMTDARILASRDSTLYILTEAPPTSWTVSVVTLDASVGGA